MAVRQDRLKKILDVTIAILSKEGAEHFSMRRVADGAALSLSNLQYYYKDRRELLIAATKHYFESCEREFNKTLDSMKLNNPVVIEQFVAKALDYLLVGDTLSDQTIMFREIWALSSRDKVLQENVHKYYKNHCEWVIALISNFSKKPELLVSLLVPYVEGYSVLGNALPLDKDAIIKMLTVLVITQEGEKL